MSRITGKTALVTGASSGIGNACVKALLAQGVMVYAGARRVERMKDLESLGAKAIELDVTDEASMDHAVQRILAETQAIDFLINNAGYGSYGALEDVPIEEARRQFEVNIFGLARMTQLVLPSMRSQNAGKIVNISSMGGKMYTPFGAWYHATKHALEGLSDCLRLETQPFGIDVIIVEPGGIKTDWGIIAAEKLRSSAEGGAYQKQATESAEGLQKRYSGNELSSPELIARTIVKSLKAQRPRTRYAVGYMAKPAIALRNLLGDRMFDRIIQRM